MKNYTNTDYAVNKLSHHIVYRSTTEKVTVTLEDYLRENPDGTEKDYNELKALSDNIYMQQVNADNKQGKKTLKKH